MPSLRIADVVEILIIAFLIYQLLEWSKNTRLMTLLKGLVIIALFVLVAVVFNMTTIMWIANHVLSIVVVAIVVVLQPELRKALEELGRRRMFGKISIFEGAGIGGRFSDKTLRELVKASTHLAKKRTGALIVLERDHPLDEYLRTGIDLDAIISSQLLINIFEHNTPLHDGAVLVRGDRIMSATCYLPLSENMDLGKELGTRHRAGVGISEITDCAVIIVSEETGKISLAYQGDLERNLDSTRLEERLVILQDKPDVEESGKIGKGFFKWKKAG